MSETVWNKLKGLPKPTLAELFDADPARLDLLATRLELGDETSPGAMRFDWSKTHLDAAHIAAFEELAEATDFAGRRAALFSGEIVNPTEGRAAEHTAQRGVGSDESVALAHEFHARMAAIVEAIHRGAMGEVKHLIHVGIGGSALGPALAIDALARDGAMVDVQVVSNIDGCALEAAFAKCDPATTMLAVASKTFTTIETMTNAESVLSWMRENGVEDPYGRVVALTAAPEKAVEWGVDETRILPFSESVGGRYSLWSSIGFPVAMALGWPDFAEFLDGAAAMDMHFRDTDGLANLPLRAAFADQYYTRLRGCQTRAVFAYDERLALLPDYLQQLEMESNGKSVKYDGSPVDGPTAPITWGGHGRAARRVPAAPSGHQPGAGGLHRRDCPGRRSQPRASPHSPVELLRAGRGADGRQGERGPGAGLCGRPSFGDDPAGRNLAGDVRRLGGVPRTPHFRQCRADGDQPLRPVRCRAGQGNRQADREGRHHVRSLDRGTSAAFGNRLR